MAEFFCKTFECANNENGCRLQKIMIVGSKCLSFQVRRQKTIHSYINNSKKLNISKPATSGCRSCGKKS